MIDYRETMFADESDESDVLTNGLTQHEVEQEVISHLSMLIREIADGDRTVTRFEVNHRRKGRPLFGEDYGDLPKMTEITLHE